MRSIRAIAAAFVVALVVAPLATFGAVNRSVSIQSNFFTPRQIYLHAGDSVTWVNDSTTNHTVTSNSGSPDAYQSNGSCGLFKADCVTPGSSFAHTFTAPGIYDYHCRIHGDDRPYPNCRMCGEIVVRSRPKPKPKQSTSSSSPTPTTSGSVSPSPSGSGSPSPGASGTSPGSTTEAAGSSGSSNSSTVAIAAVGIGLLGGTAIIVYRTMIRR